MRTPDPDALVDLCRPGSESESQIIVAVLRDEGIPATAGNLGADVFGGAMDFVIPRRVQVRRADLEHAKLYLEHNHDLAQQIDWDEVEWTQTDPEDPYSVDSEGMTPMIDKGRFFRIALVAVAILLALVFLFSTFVGPSNTPNGISPGGFP
ncbi:MAG: hypothetical protein ACI89L_001544 [Phycisphaerales bacterium]